MLKLLSLFSGIGAFEKALENIDEPFEVVRYCEIDKYASKAYSLIHNLDENMNLKDVCSVKTEDLPTDIDIITYGFPCQDISVAGKKKGFVDENGDLTRSGLFFEALHIIEETQPKVAIAENVKALVGKRFTAEFKIVLDSLNDAGYKNYWAVLNAKDYGIPQNRERVFIISIRDDIDHGFKFPEKYELKLRLKDLLEDSVDEKYYLDDKYITQVMDLNGLRLKKDTTNVSVACNLYELGIKGWIRANGEIMYTNGVCKTIDAMGGGNRQPKIVEGNYECAVQEQLSFFDNSPSIQKIEMPEIVSGRKYQVNKEKLVFTLRKQKNLCGWTNKELAEELDLPVTTVEHWFRTDKHFGIPDPEIWNDLKWLLEMDDITEFDESIMTFEDREGVYDRANRFYHENGISPTITAQSKNEKVITHKGCIQIGNLDRKGYHEFSNRIYSPEGVARTLMGEGGNNNDKTGQYLMPDFRIRKLTPKECFRLMGFDDKDCDILVENKISNSQIYKMAGNSIVVDVLEEIFVELLNQYDDVFPMR